FPCTFKNIGVKSVSRINDATAKTFGISIKKLPAVTGKTVKSGSEYKLLRETVVPCGETAAIPRRRPRRKTAKSPPEPFLTVPQAAEHAGVCYSTAYWWVATEKISPNKIKKWRGQMVLDRRDLMAFLGSVEPLPPVD